MDMKYGERPRMDYLNSSGNDFDYDKDNDGSWGYENDDGSGSFYGNDGSWGYTNSDGSGSYYGSDGESEYFDSDNDEDEGYSGSDSGGSMLGALVGLGVAAFAVSNLAKASGDYSYDDDEDDYYNNICDVIDNYNCGAYYESSYVIARAYQEGGF